MIKPAAFWEKRDGGRVICLLCPAECKLTEGKAGICTSRFNRGGELVTDNYGELVSVAVDPIEKKPLYHFYPASDILSIGPNGCNLNCVNCQNWTISQKKTQTMYLSPEQLAAAGGRHNSIGVAFTYTEPLIWYEYIMDTAPLLRKAGLKTVLVTNGYISSEPLEQLLPHVDAMNIDLKSIRPQFYKKVCKGKLEPVLHTIKRAVQAGIHVELTNLIIPGLNDTDEDLADLVEFVASVWDMIPLHFSAYHPDYKMDIPATPLQTLLRAYAMACRRLKYVYLGNVRLDQGCDTHCPNCGSLLIRRAFFQVKIVALKQGRCTACGFETGIIQ
ncbi:MAG TPA: AmmeMemoRadiSam system radical SAM enzyme [Candidatus Deferrimicrobium sp.]|nr:AmmeMemoRadiSam system radical SAM enzyme [Candidatus Deferrimicrobium sp.]